MVTEYADDSAHFTASPLQTAQTFRYLYEKPTSQLITQFVQDYNYNNAMLVAQRVVELLDAELVPPAKFPTTEGVQALLKWRAKEKDSLEEKLKMWNEETAFESLDQIKEEVKDLAGVRVILYVPSRSQYDKVGEIIRWIFGAENVHKHIPRKRAQDPKEPTTYKPIHLGYQGEHYWATLSDKHSVRQKYVYQEGDRVEIQVTSALGNAWAEAQHDVLYKSNNYGPASLQEQQIFDAVNGLVLSSDLLLQQAHDLLMGRTFAKIDDTYELESFLKGLDVLQSTDFTNIPKLPDLISRDHTEMLLNLLRKTGKNHPLAIREIVKDLGFPNNAQLDKILANFKPSFEPAAKMVIVVCLAYKLMEPNYEALRAKGQPEPQPNLESLSACEKCCVMVNALGLLQDILGHQRDRVRKFLLNEVTLTEKERDSLDWVLTDPGRRPLLQKMPTENDQKLIGEYINDGWTWFREQARDHRSICGLAFKLAAIGATKPFELEFLSKIKNIGSLSRRSTENDTSG